MTRSQHPTALSVTPTPSPVMTATTTHQVMQQQYPSVSLKDLPILERFVEYATERIDETEFDASSGLPQQAMTFAALGHFFDDAELISVLSADAQSQLIDEIRPPPGRLVTWIDFMTILQIVADAVHPTIPNEALALELVCRKALETLRALDHASRIATRTQQQQIHHLRPVDASSTTSQRHETPVAIVPSLSPPRTIEADGKSIALINPYVAASNTKLSTSVAPLSEPRKRNQAAVKPAADAAAGGYRPLGLAELVVSVSALLEDFRRKALRSMSIDAQPSHADIYRRMTQDFIDALAPVAPRPCKVKALKITFQNDNDTASQLVEALSELIASVPIVGGNPTAAVSDASIKGFQISGDVVWNVVRACGAVLFPNSPAVAQEELAFQVFLKAVEL